jgi:SAM-dependent methyltransferase
MPYIAIQISRVLSFLGIDPVKFIRNLRDLSFYFRDLRLLKKQRVRDNDKFVIKYYPILDERFEESGTMSGHYFHQDLLVAKKIFAANPTKHIDIGSRQDGFVAHVAVFREIEIIDIRAQKSKVENVRFIKADLMKLPENMINYCDSISALHSIEHFGLGRYGDPVDYFGHLKAIKNITQILKPSGIFYFSVPIGERQRIEFNGHRIFSVPYLWNILRKDYCLKSFSYVDDRRNLHENAEFTDKSIENSFWLQYGCGIFELQKNK